MAHRMPVIDDDAGQDRDHREHAGGQREQQAEAEKADQDQGQVVALEQSGDARAFVGGRRRSRRSRRCRSRRRRCGDRHCLRSRRTGCARCSGQLEFRVLIEGRVADAAVPAALRNGLQRDGAGGLHRQEDLHFLAVGLDLAEEVVFLHLSGRQLGRPQRAAFQHELELVAVHVIAVDDLPARLDGGGIDRLRREAEGLLGGEGFFGTREPRQGAQQQERQADQHEADFPSAVSGRVSAISHARYSGRPCAIGTATISGSS